jgi:hypothetical protein
MTFQKIITILIVTITISACKENKTENYQEKLMTIEQTEKTQPTRFLRAEGTYNKSLFGGKLNFDGVIKNSATVVTYKDVVVKLTYFSENKTEIGKIEHTIQDFFPPQSEKPFELKIENDKAIHSIGWEVIAATPQ